MSSRPSSRATAGEDSTTTLRSSTAKRPATKPVAPRLSTSSTATKPTSTSAARTSTTTSSSLSKPPARPSATTSTVRRPPSSAATTASSLHRTRPSTTSVEASGDESKRDGITAKPKRMSLAATTSTDKPSTLASRTSTVTPTSRRVPSSTTSSTVRPSVRSPTATTKTPLSSTTRTPVAATSRAKPTTTPSVRAATGIVDRKRLSTIPASPAVKKTVTNDAEAKEDDAVSEAEKSLVEDTEAEEIEIGTEQNQDFASLREELEESRNQVDKLKAHLAETTARMEYFGQSAEEESGKVQDATEAIRSEHAAKIEEMVAIHEKQMQELEASYKSRMEEANEEFESRIDALQDQIENEDSDRDAEVEALKNELYQAKQGVDEAVNSKMTNVLEEYGKMVKGMKADHAKKIAELQQELAGVRNSKPESESLSREKEAHAETQGLLQAVKSELNSFKQSKQEDSDIHIKELEDLKEQLVVLEKSRKEDANTAELLTKNLKTEHEGQVQGLQNMLKSAEAELQANVDLSEHHYSEAMQKLKDELETSQKQLTSTMSERDSSITDFEAQLQSARESAESAHTLHKQELESLQSKLHEATSSSESKSSEYADQLASLQTQITTQEKEIQVLKSAQDEQESKIRAELASAHEDAIEAQRGQYVDQISKLEEQSSSASRDLESLKDVNTSAMEQARAEAVASQKAALEEQASTHESVLNDLEVKLRNVTKEVDELKQHHERNLSELRAEHTQAKEVALTTLTSEHEQKISQLKSEYQSSDKDIESLKTSHSDEVGKLEARVNAMTGELDTAKFQVQSLKGILQSIEQENQQKETEQQEELEKKDKEFSEAVNRLSMQSMRIADLETAHKQAVEQAKAAVEAETQASLDALKQEHDEALNTVQRDLEEKHLSTLMTLRSEHSSAIESLVTEVDIRDKSIEGLKVQHANALAELQTSSQRGNTDALEKLQTEHSSALDELKATLLAAHEAYVQELESKHADKAADDSKKFGESLERTKAEHNEIVTTLRADLEQTREKLRDTSEVDTLNAKLSASQQAFGNLQEEQATTMSSMSKEHVNEVSKLQDEVKALQAQANKPVDTTELNNAKSELAASKLRLAEVNTSHAEAIGAKDVEHATAIQALQTELVEAQTIASSAKQNATEMEEVKNLLNDAQRTVSELSEQYAMAAMDAETQRLAAESAKKELMDLKKSLSEASVIPQTPDTKKVPVKPANGSAKPSPKAGLQASKWAAAEPEEAPAAASNGGDQHEQESGQGLGLRGGSTTVAPSADGPVPRPKRNVAGQMAGIQENIRQLAEMNEEFLDDHQKWARSLSRVDDDGTITVAGTDTEAQDGKEEEETHTNE